jgi:hypothetical protein
MGFLSKMGSDFRIDIMRRMICSLRWSEHPCISLLSGEKTGEWCMRQALIVRAPELRLRCACQLVDLYKTKQSGTQRLKAPCGCATACKTSRNLVLRCRLHEDFPHANKCNLLNLEILQLIQLSWGIEDFSSFLFPTPQVSGHPKAPKTFLGFLGPIAPIKTEAHPEFFKNTIESSQLVLTIFINFCCFQTII